MKKLIRVLGMRKKIDSFKFPQSSSSDLFHNLIEKLRERNVMNVEINVKVVHLYIIEM